MSSCSTADLRECKFRGVLLHDSKLPIKALTEPSGREGLSYVIVSLADLIIGPCHLTLNLASNASITNTQSVIPFNSHRESSKLPYRIVWTAHSNSGNPVGAGGYFAMATTHASKARRQPKGVLPTPSAPLADVTTMGDLLKRLGDIPAGRVRLHPTPGTATEKEVLAILDRENRPCELVEGTLVEKPVGYEESEIAGLILTSLNNFVRPRKLGIVTGPDGTIKLLAGLVRIPDVAFASWARFPDRKRPRTPIPHLAPDLVVEVLNKSNTRPEMKRKLGEYFAAGVRLVWMVDPRKKTARVHTSVDQSVLIKAGQSLDGRDVLPGFVLPLDELFASDEP